MKLDFSIALSQILAFLIMLWVLKLVAWKPFLKMLNERRAKIESEFLELEQEKLAVKKMAASYQSRLDQVEEEAKKKLQQAAEKAERAALERASAANKEAREILEKAREQIYFETEQAHHDLKETLVNLVVSATEKMLQEKLEEGKDRKIISDFITQGEWHESQ